MKIEENGDDVFDDDSGDADDSDDSGDSGDDSGLLHITQVLPLALRHIPSPGHDSGELCNKKNIKIYRLQKSESKSEI